MDAANVAATAARHRNTMVRLDSVDHSIAELRAISTFRSAACKLNFFSTVPSMHNLATAWVASNFDPMSRFFDTPWEDRPIANDTQ